MSQIASAMATAVAVRPLSPPAAPFGMRVDLVMLDQVLIALEHGHAGDRDLDAEIYQALGWTIQRTPITRRRISWRCRSPLAAGWLAMPHPTGDLADAASLVPHGWDWWAGLRGGLPRGWCQARRARPGQLLPTFFEQSRLTVERSLAAAALFAHRHIARGR